MVDDPLSHYLSHCFLNLIPPSSKNHAYSAKIRLSFRIFEKIDEHLVLLGKIDSLSIILLTALIFYNLFCAHQLKI